MHNNPNKDINADSTPTIFQKLIKYVFVQTIFVYFVCLFFNFKV